MHSPRKIEFDSLLAKVRLHLAANRPFVLYSLPNDTKVTLLLQEDSVLNLASDFTEKGFVFAPFDSSKEAILIPPDTHFSAHYEDLKNPIRKNKRMVGKGKSPHIRLVANALKAIKSGSLKKVVLSRKVTVDHDTEAITLFTRALAMYPKAFCYLWFHPKIGTWLGASPEQLVTVEDTVLKTTSLAGTLPVLNDQEPQWTPKELEEQQMVTDYLKNRLKKYVEDVEIDGLTSVKAGQLWHLKTNLKVRLKTTDNLKAIISEIHPSPAICGIPKDAAKAFITSSEGYNRSFYTGFLGELNLNECKSAKLFVNLRCMELKGKTATLFVGGGITADSDPEREWEETKNKCGTMLALL